MYVEITFIQEIAVKYCSDEVMQHTWQTVKEQNQQHSPPYHSHVN